MNYKLIFFIPVMIALFVVGIQLNSTAHEETHAAIDTYFNAQNITIMYKAYGLLGGNETAYYPKGTDMKTIYSLHALNDIVGYQYNSLYMMFMITLILIGMILFAKEGPCKNCGYSV